MEKIECPECAAGKCINCDGIAYDSSKDELVECDCRKAGHNKLLLAGVQ